MQQFSVSREPLRVIAMGTTRAGLINACLHGLFAAIEQTYPEIGDEVARPFEFTTDDTPSLMLAILRTAASSAMSDKELYADITFSLITDKKATGSFVGRSLGTAPKLPTILGIDGQVAKDGDGVWRATLALSE